MARELTFNITEDRRRLVEPTNVEGFEITFDRDIISGSKNWVDGRIGEDAARQVFVNVKYGPNNEAYDLTGIIPEFCGLTAKGGPENRNYSIIDNWHSVMIDPQGGRFRFDFPKDAFAVAGSYKQAFFNLKREGSGEVVATLEFDMKVMANFVYSNIIPKDFITPYLEVLDRLISEFKQGNVQKEELISELQKTVQNKLDIIEVTFKSTNDTLESLRATANSLSEKIKQDGLFTQGEAEEFKQSILNEFENFKNSTNETFDDFLNKISSKISGGSVNSLVKDYNVKGAVGKLKDFANKISKDAGFKILFVTDQHYRVSEYTTDPVKGTNYAKAFPLSLNMTNNLAILDDVVDAAVFNGDNVDGAISLNQAYPSDMIDNIIQENPHETPNVKYAKSINRTLINAARDALPSTDVYINLGNHDDNSIAQKYDGYILDKEDLLDVYEFDSNNFGEERYDFSCYKDYPKSKVRIGVIGAYDNPEIYDGDNSGKGRGNVKYRRGYHSVITQETLNFVKKALETCPDEYTMLWFSHLPLKGYFNGATETVSDADSLPIRVNHELLTGMFSAYANRRAFSGTGTNQDYPASISVDFTKSKGSIAGLVFGHEHRDKDMQNINGVPGIVRQCFLAASRADGDKFDTIEQYSFDVIELDTNSKQVFFKRFGDGGDTSYGY